MDCDDGISCSALVSLEVQLGRRGNKVVEAKRRVRDRTLKSTILLA